MIATFNFKIKTYLLILVFNLNVIVIFYEKKTDIYLIFN